MTNTSYQGNLATAIHRTLIPSHSTTQLTYGLLFAGLCSLNHVALAVPSINSHTPTTNPLTAPTTDNVVVNFNEAIKAASVTNSSFIVTGSQSGPHNDKPSVNDSTITLNPSKDFEPGETVTVTLTTGIQNTSDVAMDAPQTWQFTVKAPVAPANFLDSGQNLGNSDSRSVTLGDVNGDGYLDAWVANISEPNRVWFNNGLGIFTDNRIWINNGSSIFTKSNQPGLLTSTSVALGDIDGDDDLDAWVTNTNGEPNNVWLNDGSGMFTDSGQNLGNSYSRTAKFGDVDGDGDLDAWVTNSNSQANRVWFNDGSGNFTDSGQSLGNFDSTGIALADLDGDDDLDAWVTNGNGQGNRVWLNNLSSLSLSANPSSFSEAGGTSSITVTRNGETIADLTVSLSSSDTSEATVPASVIIAAGQTSANFNVTAVDDSDLEGSQTVTITANATNYISETTALTVIDNEVPPPSPAPSPVPTPTPVPTPISNEPPPPKHLNVSIVGDGEGIILSKQSGIDCTRNDDAICQSEFTMGTSITLTATPAEGSEFIGWNSDCSEGEFTINTNMECIATFKLLPKTLTVTINGNGSIKSIPLALNCDETSETCNHAFSADSRIKLISTSSVSWAGDCDENGIVVLTTDKECKANFVQNAANIILPVITPLLDETPIVTPSLSPEETTSPMVTPEDSTPVAIPSLPEETISPITPDDSASEVTPPPVTTSPEEQTPVVNQVTLTVDKVGNGTIINQHQDFICHNDVEQCTYTIKSGETVTFTATPDNGWQFESWNGDCDKMGNVTLLTNQVCTANFAPIPVPPSMQPVVEPILPVPATVETPLIEFIEPISSIPVIVEPPIVENIPITTTIEPPEIMVPVITTSGTIEMVTKPVISHSDGKRLCPTTGIVDWVCDAKWQELTQMIIEKEGNVGQGIVIDTLINRGRFANIQIREEAIVQCEGENSYISGYIDNQGTIIDCDFKGREIKGGTLSGTITNSSKVGGYFQDVYLAPHTHILGGKLQGKIIGDAEAPAWLENLILQSGSFLDNVIIGDNVKKVDDVELGKGVRFETSFMSQAVGVDNLGNPASEVQTDFVCLASPVKPIDSQPVKVVAGETITVSIVITLDQNHVQRGGELLIVQQNAKGFDMRVAEKWQVWNGEISDLEAAAFYDELPNVLERTIQITPKPGKYSLYVGYRLEEGTVIYNGENPVNFLVTDGKE
jgi:hypothetical protein